MLPRAKNRSIQVPPVQMENQGGFSSNQRGCGRGLGRWNNWICQVGGKVDHTTTICYHHYNKKVKNPRQHQYCENLGNTQSFNNS